MASLGSEPPIGTAREASLVGCTHCARAWPEGTETCGRCGARLRSRKRRSLVWVWMWWGLGLAAYIPANIYPMLATRTLFGQSESPIVPGALDLAAHGAVGVALVVLLASVVIPVGKFLAVGYLALAAGRGWQGRTKWRMWLYEAVEFIGRWSMIDVFVVALLAALVKFSIVVTITPGPAALAFALSVVFTMLAARAFDPRLIWDIVDGKADR